MSAPLPEVDAGFEAALDNLARRTGLSFEGSHRRRMVDSVMRAGRGRLASLGLNSASYASLIDDLTVNETYFFREPKHLELFVDTIVPEVLADAAACRQVRIWCAGCASGEEPYSIAITLAEAGFLERSSIVGTDLSPKALDRARVAEYGAWSLRRCDARQRAAYFHRVGDRFRLDARYASAVDLVERNLLEGPPADDAFDVVTCRNVLIYLTRDAIQVAARSLHDALVPGGWLILGASDPLLDHPGLTRIVTPGGIAYRRVGRAGGADLLRAPDDRRVATVVRTERVGARRSPRGAERRRARIRSASLGRGDDGVEPVEHAGAGDDSGSSSRETACLIRSLGSTGDLVGARAVAEDAVAARPLDPELWYLNGLIALLDGRVADAARAASAALYLDPNLVVAHVLLGRADQQRGGEASAARRFVHAVGLLGAMAPDAEVPHADGASAAEMIGALRPACGSASAP